MTIDSHTGFIILSEIGAFISPTLQRAQFLQNPAFAEAQVLVQNDPWCSYGLPLIDLEDSQLSVTFQFEGEHLHALCMAHMAPRFGAGWKDRTEAKELQRKAFHDHWLANDIGVPPGTYPWAEVSSLYDAKSGGSSIVIRFQHTANS
ncbi:MAG TPA: hypothetical protein VGE39_21285 [Prosthecobacter sp.]